MLENLFNSPFLTSLALTLLHFLWQGMLVAAVLKSALLIFNNHKPQLRYALSALAMLVNLLLPIITFIIIYRAELSTANSFANSLALSELIEELKQPDSLFSYNALIEALGLFLPYLSILWLATITLLASKLLIEITTVNRLPQQSTVIPSDALQTRFVELAKQLNLKITPRLLISLKVEVPMAIGWLKPVVLLPASMISGLNSTQLEMLILHELAHIRRHDYLVNFLQTLVEILLFFHPAVLWVSKQMRNEREYCSDDIAVQHCGDAIAYAHTLADTASLCTKTHNHTIPDMAMAASGGDLKQRVIRLVDHHCAPSNNISKWFASATIIFSILLLSSKQLLTMPLLDILYIEAPWKQENHSFSRDNSDTNNAKSSNSTHSNLPNTSIAQQLLTPQQLTTNNEIQKSQAFDIKKPKMESEPLLTSTPQEVGIKKSSEEIAVKSNQAVLTSAQSIINENNQFNTSLNNLAVTTPVQPKEQIEHTITQQSVMVEEAFDRTNSHNPYQQELAQLSAEPSQADLTNKNSLNKLNNSQASHLLKKTSSTNQIGRSTLEGASLADTITNNSTTTKALSDVNYRKEKIIKPLAPTWHNAKQLKSADPIYPSIAKRKGIELEVKVNFTIDVAGHIKDIQFDHQNKVSYFKNAIRSAIKKWRFLPAKVDDKPVESQMSKVFAFSLQH